MSSMSERRSSALPTVLLAAGTCLLASLVRHGSEAFLTAAPAAASASAARGRVAMRGFKEDFQAWRSTLTPDERKLVTKQAQKEYNKNFRKSDEFKKNIPEEKIQSFAKILGKFFDSEAEDYKKEQETKVPDYDGLTRKAQGKKFDFSLKQNIVEVDREADRRYRWAVLKVQAAEQKGELFPQSSPQIVPLDVPNNDAESHGANLKIIETMKELAAHPNAPASAKAAFEEWIREGVPAQGQPFTLHVPEVIYSQFEMLNEALGGERAHRAQNSTEAELKNWEETVLPKLKAETMKLLYDNWYKAKEEVEFDAQQIKAFFSSQKDVPGKTKADVLKEMWEVIPKITGQPVAPLDDEVLAEFSQIPAVVPEEYRHSWGIADKLYKSEAIDAFGQRYLLGVFEDKADAQKAFEEWNAEYEKARAEMALELQQFSKQEQARSDRDTEGADRIKKVLEESRR